MEVFLMGFFKDFKEDLAQAVNELLPDQQEVDDTELDQEHMVNTLDSDDAAKEMEAESAKMMELLNEFTMDNIAAEDDLKEDIIENDIKEDIIDTEPTDIEEIKSEDMEDGEKIMEDNIDLELLEALNADEEQEVKATPVANKEEKAANKVRSASVANEDDVTVITKGTTINGSITTNGSLDIMGTVNGDIDCLGKLSITGQVKGNSTASEIFINTERFEGSLMSEGSVKIALGTVVIGDINATSGVFAGAVKGEIDINGPVVIDSTAIIKGNIKAKSVQVNNGAVIEGFCSLAYADVDVDNIFE
jgi:cytoskeletal protein CcmA (bactofilin family)